MERLCHAWQNVRRGAPKPLPLPLIFPPFLLNLGKNRDSGPNGCREVLAFRRAPTFGGVGRG
jgi:hypothetical protein